MKAKNLQEHLIARLEKHRGKHSKIARECRIGQATVSRVARGLSSPTLVVAQRLFDWLDKADAAATGRSRRPSPSAVERNAS